MKRFGEKAVREAIANGAIIRAWDWYTLEAGYRVIIDGETAGYIVSDLFSKLINDGTITKDHQAYSYVDYKAAAAEDDEIAAEEATQEASFRVCYHENGVYQRVIVEAANAESARAYVQQIQPDAVVFAVKLMAGEPQKPGEPVVRVPADFIPAAEENAAETEKTAEEWAAESERVQEATAAALAAVIATEEAPAEAAQDARTPYERVIAKNPDCPNAWRLPGYPGAVYSITYNDDRGGLWTVHFPTLREYQNEIERLRKEGATIEKTTKTEAGQTEEIPAETYQEATDRENHEHCKRIADELEAYADGRVYRCPSCGAHVQDNCLFCDCGEPVDLFGDWEQMSLYDYFADCLDIEYRCGSDREYRSVSIMVACGGPNIYIDTAEKAVLLYWWTDRARYYLSSEAVEAVDEWAEEYWNCL